ncbi:MAG: serine hydrolase [Flavisolibacter sp.]|nr:serine hydrolase [Flavisolibacter sp.]
MKNLLIALLFVLSSAVQAQTGSTSAVLPFVIKEGAPESAGMSSVKLQQIDKLFQESINKGWMAGASTIIIRNGKIVYHKATGYNDIDSKTPLKRDAIFRIASQTKAITSIAIMMLYEEGKLLLDEPVSKYIPEFKNPKVLDSFIVKDSSYTTKPAKSEITIRQLLTHTSGLDYPSIGSPKMRAIYAKGGISSGIGMEYSKIGDNVKRLAVLPLVRQPGEGFTYSLSTDVLGYLVEVVSGLTLDQFFRQRIFAPLGMNDTYFYLPKEKYGRLAALYTEDTATHRVKKSPKTVNGFNADYPAAEGTFYSGGAGLSSTPYDYALFLQMILNGGEYNGKRLLSRPTVRMMLSNQLPDAASDFWFGLGFGLVSPKGSARTPQGEGTFYWGGYFNTTYWADPKEKLIVVMMKQQVPNTHGDIDEKFKALVYSAINN